MLIFNIIANVCSILSLLLAIFIANEVKKIKIENVGNQRIDGNENTQVGRDLNGQ